MLKRLLLLAGLTAPAWSMSGLSPWTEDLLGLTGTTLVFDSPAVQAAIVSGQVPADIGKLAKQAGFRGWAGGRIILLQRSGGKLVNYATDDALKTELNRRNLVLSTVGTAPTLEAIDKGLSTDPLALQPLRRQIQSLSADALIIINPDSKGIRWQFISLDFQQTGYLELRGRDYLPDVWAENLAVNWQWPELGQAALVSIQSLSNFAQFKSAENLLSVFCTQTSLLRFQGHTADFACQTVDGKVPEKLSLTPTLVPVPLQDSGLDPSLLIGRQISNRYAAFRWQIPQRSPQ